MNDDIETIRDAAKNLCNAGFGKDDVDPDKEHRRLDAALDRLARWMSWRPRLNRLLTERTQERNAFILERNEATAEVERLREFNDEGVGEIMRLTAEVERLRDLHDSAIAKVVENANEVERLREGHDEWKWGHHAGYEQALADRKAEVESLRAAQAEAWDEVEVQHREVERLREELNEATFTGTKLRLEVEKLRKSKSQLKRENVQAGRDVLDGLEEK